MSETVANLKLECERMKKEHIDEIKYIHSEWETKVYKAQESCNKIKSEKEDLERVI